MILVKTILLLFILPFVDVKIYIFNTVDSPSVELYDCIIYGDFFYCRRPTEPVALNRSSDAMKCHHNGTPHSFADLRRNDVSISTILHQWKSSIEKVEHYTRYLKNDTELDEYICECTDAASFGKNCEYLLPMGTTLAQTVTSEYSLKQFNPIYVQQYGDIICYTTLDCNSGLLCLDWRDICDGVQQCMSGLDEENCDKLEFNECEKDEYRCMNGMCVPEEYFLDGEFDCLDWSDEIQYYDGTYCPIEAPSTQCDDRICPPYQFSCGDGQCIRDRFEFQKLSEINSECRSRRDQYFICETHYVKNKWTLPSGRCFEGDVYKESNVTNRTATEQCQYLFLCDLSEGIEKHCPCRNNPYCTKQLNATCLSDYIQYPNAGIMAPYVLFFYPTYVQTRPEFIRINGTIKCDGILVNISISQLSFISNLRHLEDELCQRVKDDSLSDSHHHGQGYRQESLTFDNRSYSLSDVCSRSRKWISTYRVKDGFMNCMNETDERANISISRVCSKMQRYRFRCSAEEPTCLSVTALGNLQNDCTNKFDEFWFGTSTQINNINCNKAWQDQCEILRQYIENSWILNSTNQVVKELRIPFRHHCDTFWNLDSKEDENINECRVWWTCANEQWKCATGQCIDGNWLLDGEWDCFDASEEGELSSQFILERNLQVVPFSTLRSRSIRLNRSIPFSSFCNLTTEFPCLPVHFVNLPKNLTHDRPCINRQSIGDGHIDCYGAIDERNMIPHCSQPTMLGYNFKCTSTNDCIPYWNHCRESEGDRCTNPTDDALWCDKGQSVSTCYEYTDSVCFNGTCVKGARCNGFSDCLYSEDEYMCEYQSISKLTSVLYRKDKEILMKNTEQKLRLIRFPSNSNATPPTTDSTSAGPKTPTGAISLNNTAPIAYWCNRGVGITMYNGSIVCFCPPQYYGDKCQFHTDRITLLIHLNLSQSIYTVDSDIRIVLKLVVLFLFRDEVITNSLFHVRPAAEMFFYRKKTIQLLYSRSFQLLQHKIQRYFNQSNIADDHPYSIRIELYETIDSGAPVLNAVWQYPVYFDYLPVFRFSKVLRLTKPTREQNPCLSNPCNQNQDCQQLQNKKSDYVCLCKGNFTGENCLIPDPQCTNGFCSFGSICKPTYRGLLLGNELPYCICLLHQFGEQCDIIHERCQLLPCRNNGTCYVASQPDTIQCICTEEYQGKNCELRKPEIKLHINESITHVAAVVQYFDIDFISLNLILSYQQVYPTLPNLLEYRHEQKTAPEIILVKLYSSYDEISPELYLISVHVNFTTIYATTQVSENTRCMHIRTLISTNETQRISDYSPIKYHFLCQNNTDLFCFRDDFYLCICDEDHSRAECFRYNYPFDQCPSCLAGGRCLKGDRSKSNDYICLCPPCHSGTKCQFNSNSFAFTLDQLFFTDLNSVKQQKITLCLLIIIPLLLALIALPNNLFSFATFRREKCLSNGAGYYLLLISIINQINLSILVARLIHLSISITGLQSHPIVDNILCKVLNYLLICFTRIAYWLVSFVATERVYTVVFLKGQWLKKPYVAQRLIALMFFIVFASGAYELVFIGSFSFNDDGDNSMCVIEFPMTSRLNWMLIHRIVWIIHSMLPILINLCCTITMIYIITKSKMNIRRPEQGTEGTDMTPTGKIDTVEAEGDDNKNLKPKEIRHRLYVLRDVISDNREIISRPTITLIPSIFSLFSLPLFIISFSLGCRNIENHPTRYALIVFNFISFIPQIITFFLYVYPSSLYFNEWRLTRMGQWITALKRQSTVQNTIIRSTPKKETTLKNFSESKQ